MKFGKNKEAQKALQIGSLCAVAYLIVYLGRNLLSTVSPQLIERGVLSIELVGRLSSLFFICYAVGQLLNGIIGESIKAKYMISFGLIIAGSGFLFFGDLIEHSELLCVLYGLIGFALSMIYAPIVKITAENTNEVYSGRCCLGYETAALFGTPLAGVIAVFLVWKQVFLFGGAALILMGLICLVVFSRLEKKGVVKYKQFQRSKEKGGIKVLLENQIVKFTVIAILTGVIRTAVVFWIPTYLSEHLGFSSEVSAVIFTVVSLLISLSAFLSVFLYEKLGHSLDRTLLLGFAVSTVAFVGTYFVHQKWANITLFVLAIVFEQCVSAMIWNRYCPSLRDTGMVSSVTGFLDFASYMAASISSSIFANSVEQIGWGNLILVWAGLMFIGVLITLPYKARKVK